MLVDVQELAATSCAFAAITAKGEVVCWGDPNQGGLSSEVHGMLKSVVRCLEKDLRYVEVVFFWQNYLKGVLPFLWELGFGGSLFGGTYVCQE